MKTPTMKIFCCLLLAAPLASGCRTPQAPANPAANVRAKAVLRYFQSLETRSDRRLVSGQFSNFGDRANLDLLNEIHDRTGHWPALLGVDYAGRGGISTEAPDRAAIEYWQGGGLVTVSTHLYDPARATHSAFGGLRDKDVDLNILLEPNSEAHARWLRELDRVAAGLQELQTNGVVVLWRPFHEMNGNWFWWDGKDPATFKKLWRQMFDYFTKTKGLDNLLWVYAPNHGTNTAVYYPGNRYVDLVGLDAYTDFVDTNHIFGYPAVARLPKPFGFTEFGPHGPSNPPGDYDYLRFLQGVQTNFPRTVFFMSWNAKWSLAQNSNVTEMLGSPWVVNRDDLPKGLAGSR
ncbi:MAG TPA: glycosyl hydrolase [Candidatus Sulfopaludibacter sp.]|nr:glycosyl hydrolase [Candidatus Sulfopaludibacter sp.]